MKKLVLFILMALISTTTAQDQNASMEEQMKIWTEYMTPGDMHKMLAESEGEWKTITKTWMAPGAEPEVTEGSVTAEMIYGGRYLKMEHSGSVMGIPFDGMSIEGFDNVKKKFINTWIDNMGTGIAIAEGTFDPETNTITYVGTMSDPMTKGDVKFKNVMEIKSKDESVFTMYMDMNGTEVKWMEMTYTRK